MTLETLRPTGTIDAPSSVTGAATAHQATSDDSDSTYCTGSLVTLSLGSTAASAGSIVKHERIRLRGRADSISLAVTATLTSASVPGALASLVKTAGTTIITHTGAYQDAAALQEPLDDLRVTISCGAFGFRTYELYLDRVYVEQPVVTLDAIADPFEDSTYVPVSWVNTLDSDGGGQTHYRVWATDDDNNDAIAYDSGIVAGSATSHVVGPLLSGGAYTVHVEIAQTVNGAQLWSDPDTQADIDIDVDTAEIDSITATPDNANAKIGLSVAWDDTSETPGLIEVDRLDESGWVPVRGATLVAWDGASAFEVDDYEATNGYEHHYRARAYWFDGDQAIVGEWYVTPSPIAWTLNDCRIHAPGTPSINTAVKLALNLTEEYGVEQGVFWAPGAAVPIVVTGARRQPTGTLTVRTRTPAEAAAFKALLQAPVWYVTAPAGWDWDIAYVSPGAVTRNRGGKASSHVNTWTVPFTPVERPPDIDAGEL